jgi:hypothetical protein
MQPLAKHYHSLLDLYQKYYGTQQMSGIIAQATLNLGNLHQVLQRGLHPDNPDLADNIRGIISLNHFTRTSGRGATPLLDLISAALPHPCNHELEARFITEVFTSSYLPIGNPESLIEKARLHFTHLNDPALECKHTLFSLTLTDTEL